MPVAEDFAKLEAQLGRFQGLLEQLEQGLPPSDPQVQQVRGLRQSIQNKYDEFTRAFHVENKRLDQEMAGLNARIQAGEVAARAASEANAKKTQELKAAQPAPKPMPVADAALGPRLRKLLLNELEKSAMLPEEPEEREVAGMESSDWKYEQEPAKPAAVQAEPTSPPRQPRKPKAGGESFEWESTGEWPK